MTEDAKTPAAEKKPPPAAPLRVGLARLRSGWGKLYAPWGRISARFIDYLGATDKRRQRASITLAIAVNLIVLTLLSTFARVRIWIPNAPSDFIQVTLVEPLPFDLALRDPDLEPLPEPEPEVVEEPEPEPEPEPETEPAPAPVEQPAETEPPQPEPAPEPEPVEEPEPEAEPQPELNLDLDPQFAPPAEDPEPFIPDPVPDARDEVIAPAPEEEPLLPEPEAEQPLVEVEPETEPVAGLDELVGEEEGEGLDDSETETEGEEAEPEEPVLAEDVPEETPANDDMFDEEPVFGRRSFVAPQVALPSVDLTGQPLPDGAAAILPGDSGVVAIFCPEQFTNEDKQKECAGRTEIRSGWRPGSSGEDWSRASELLKNDRERGVAGPTAGPVVRTLREQRDYGEMEALQDFRRSQGAVNNLPDAGDDKMMRGVEGNRPNIGPKDFEPSWTLREDGEFTQKELEEIREKIREDDDE